MERVEGTLLNAYLNQESELFPPTSLHELGTKRRKEDKKNPQQTDLHTVGNIKGLLNEWLGLTVVLSCGAVYHGWLDKGSERRGMLYAYKECFCLHCAQHN